MASANSSPQASLPLGVAILAILVGIYGLLLVIGGLLAIVSIGLYGLSFLGLGLVAGAIVLIFGIILLAVASGLWDLELWALALAILVVLVLVAWNAYDYFVAGKGISWLSFVIEIVLLIYLVAVSDNFT
jgi:hypothetical protein